MKIKSLSALLRDCEWSNDNLHRIAISNLSDNERVLVRWWCKKYQTPQKSLNEHTWEELYIEMLEDYYSEHPEQAERFMNSVEIEEWDGRTSPEHEAQMRARLKRINENVDLKKYQSDVELSEEEEKQILENLGRNLPKSRMAAKAESDLEFEDNFLGSGE